MYSEDNFLDAFNVCRALLRFLYLHKPALASVVEYYKYSFFNLSRKYLGHVFGSMCFEIRLVKIQHI